MNVNAKKIDSVNEKLARFQAGLAEMRAEDEKIKALLAGFERSVDELQAGLDEATADLARVTADLEGIDEDIKKTFG